MSEESKHKNRLHVQMSVDMTLDELDRELASAIDDPVKSRMLEAARSSLPRGEARDGGTHTDIPHMDFYY